jgi:hypothetical protein
MADGVMFYDLEPDIELRIDGDQIVCDWGVIDNPEGDPHIGFKPLIIVGFDWFKKLIEHGPQRDRFGTLCSAELLPSGIFAYAERAGRRWSWKLSKCHWFDAPGFDNAPLIGRWMD